MRIALDVDGTLADTWGAVIDRTDVFDEEPADCWEEDRDLWDQYLHHSQNAWHNHWHEIDRNELFTMTATNMIVEWGHDLDVVTARSGVEEQMQRWLDEHRVAYDEFIVETEKHELDYDVHIDDSVSLPRNVTDNRIVMMPVRNYNMHVAYGDHEHVYPIRHLRHAAFLLTSPKDLRMLKNDHGL